MQSTNQNKQVSNHQLIINDSLVQLQPPVNIRLDKNLIFSINLSCSFGYTKDSNELMPVSGRTYTAGLLRAVDWIPEEIKIETGPMGSNLKYDVSGIIVWRLLNFTMIQNHKTYTGVIDVSQSRIGFSYIKK